MARSFLKEKQATRDYRTPAIASLAWREPKDLKINENIGLATLD